MKKIILLVLVFLNFANAQNPITVPSASTNVFTNQNFHNASGLYNASLNNTNFEFLTNTQMLAITTPKVGREVYNTTDAKRYYYNGTSWVVYTTGIPSLDWVLTGNAGTIQATNFLGTTDNVGLSFRTNNVIRQTITDTGNIGIGTTLPTKKLDIISPVYNTYASIQGVNLFGDATNQPGYLGYRIGLNNSTGNASASFDIARTSGTAYLGAEINSASRDGVRILTGATEATLTEKVRINNTGNVGIGTTTPTERLHVVDGNIKLGSATSLASPILRIHSSANVDGSGGSIEFNEQDERFGYAIRHNTNGGTRADGLWFESKTLNVYAPVFGYTSAGNVGIGNTNPTSTFQVNGSEAGSITVITATTTLNATHHKILVSNAAVNITITLPDALTCLGREYIFSRAAGSTGSITLQRTGTNTIQALNGTTGTTSSIGNHSGAGAGLRHSFTAVNIGGVGVWVRI